jgi:DNA/RNA-binding domain of Phe-tRNA-synthetase-like protein
MPNFFSYHPDILQRFPNICGGVILADEITNPPTPPDLQAIFFAEQRSVLQRIGQTPLSELPSLAAWRQSFRAFGTDPTKYRSASEALLRRLTKKGDIPSINTLVDICNLISIRYALPVAAFDLGKEPAASLTGRYITVQFASGSELFIAHDQTDEAFPSGGENPPAGEVIFVDEAGGVVARRWCWKQSAESTVDLATRQVLFTIESQHPGGKNDIQAAVEDLLSLLRQYTTGSFTSYLCGQADPR